VRGSVKALDEQLDSLAKARKAFDDYAQSIESSILSNFSFKDAVTGAMDEAGNVSGVAFVDALGAQITSLQNFANVLTSLRASGAEQSLVDQISAMGPDAGAQLGQELIDSGLVPSVQAQVTTVQTLAKETGLAMAEQFKGAGVEAAINLVDNAIKQVRKDRKKLTELGDGIGKLIGSGIKKEIAQAVAEAVRAAEAAKAAARAEAVAAAEARAQIITDQQVGQAFARIIAASNARTGRDTNPLLA
jgi:Sec-independent protein translocase protein TatA